VVVEEMEQVPVQERDKYWSRYFNRIWLRYRTINWKRNRNLLLNISWWRSRD
jgi:hypothetical protein